MMARNHAKTMTSRRATRLASFIITIAAICGLQSAIFAQVPKAPRSPDKDRPRTAGAAVALAPNQPAPPAGFDVVRKGISRGKITTLKYESKSAGGTFRATVYTPPSFSPGEKYPVLYLLHGASGDENTWVKDINAAAILDNLYSAGKLAPMIVVMPSSLSVAARKQAGDSRDAKADASATFGDVLLRDLIPLVESKYSVFPDREHRALAGLSRGANLALGVGLVGSDTFAWLGVFSGGNARQLTDNSQLDLSSPGRQPRLLWLSVGNRDEVVGARMAELGALLTKKRIPHVFRINDGGHEPKVWMSDLYYFAPMLFPDVKAAFERALENN